jgi:hypothetical protein
MGVKPGFGSALGTPKIIRRGRHKRKIKEKDKSNRK